MREDMEYIGLDAGTYAVTAAGRVVGIGFAQPTSLSFLTASALW
jgi:hypothetical protein